MKNWKTSLFGILAILLSASGPVLKHYVPIAGLDWVTLCTTLGTFVGGWGLLAAKDASTHSTIAQVQASTAVTKAMTPAAAEQAKVQVKQADILADRKP
jgi:hypothetical protein